MASAQYSLYLRNYLAVTGSLISAMTGSKAYCYDGAIPASPDFALGTGVTLIVTISDDGGAGGLSFDNTTTDGGLYKLPAQTWKGTVANPDSEEIDFARFRDGSGNTLLQCDAVLTGQGLRMAELSPVDTAEQPVSGFQLLTTAGTTIQRSLLLRQYIVQTGSYRDAMQLGKLKIYADTAPASVEDALTGQELLATITNNSTATGLTFNSVASDGLLEKTTTEVWSGLVANPSAKDATFWRFEDAGAQVLLQGPVNATGGAIFEDAAPLDASTLTIRRFAFAIPV